MPLNVLIILLNIYIIYILFILFRERFKSKTDVINTKNILVVNTMLILLIFLVFIDSILVLGAFGGYDVANLLASSIPLLIGEIIIALTLVIKYTRSQQWVLDAITLVLVSSLLVLSVTVAWSFGGILSVINAILILFLLRKTKHFKPAFYIVLILSAYLVYMIL